MAEAQRFYSKQGYLDTHDDTHTASVPLCFAIGLSGLLFVVPAYHYRAFPLLP